MPPRPGPRRPAESDLALVLRRTRYGESSLVVRLLTREHGGLSVMAKGAYRPTSGYFAVLDLFDTLALSWRVQPRADLALLTAGSVVERRRALTADLRRYRAGLSMLELAHHAAHDGHRDTALFDLLSSGLGLLQAGVDPALARVAFELRLLAALGLAPALARCASCGEAAPSSPRAAEVAFSASAGGRLCPPCAGEVRALGRRVEGVPLPWLRIAQSVLETPLAGLARIRLDAGTLAALGGFVERFLEYHLESRPRSWGRGARARRPRRAPRTRTPPDPAPSP